MRIGQVNSKCLVNIILKVQKAKQKNDAFLSFIPWRTFVQYVIPVKNTLLPERSRKNIPG